MRSEVRREHEDVRFFFPASSRKFGRSYDLSHEGEGLPMRLLLHEKWFIACLSSCEGEIEKRCDATQHQRRDFLSPFSNFLFIGYTASERGWRVFYAALVSIISLNLFPSIMSHEKRAVCVASAVYLCVKACRVLSSFLSSPCLPCTLSWSSS